MTLFAALSTGFVIGLSVVMPVGPTSLLCIQRTLAFGIKAGVLTGLGAAMVTVSYASLIIAGLSAASPLLEQGRHVLSLAGGLMLLGFSARTFLRARLPLSRVQTAVLSPVRAAISAAVFNLTNPIGPLLMLAALSSATELHTATAKLEVATALGIFAGAIGWWSCLSSAVGLLRARMSPRVLHWLNIVAAALLSLYGVVSLSRSVQP